MATNLALDDNLILEAQKIGNHKTKKDAVNEALAEYVKRKKQQKVIDLFNSVDYEDDYDYKTMRKDK